MDPFIYPRNSKTPLWRVFDKDHIKMWLETGKLYFPRPQNWDDPFENILLKARYRVAGTDVPLDFTPRLNNYFGQCWTRQTDETDATWRIYSHNKTGVRVRTSVDRLYTVLDKAVPTAPKKSIFVCRVDYFKAKVIHRHARLAMEFQKAVNDKTGGECLMFLTIKRPEFKHEKEVRIIFRDMSATSNSVDPAFLIPAAPQDIIREFVIDPRMLQADVDAFKALVQAHLPKVKVTQSDLYKLPDEIIPVYS